MPERKETADSDRERPVRSRKGPTTQARSEKKRRPAGKGSAKTSRTIPTIGKRDPTRSDTSGDGLH